MTEIAGRGLPGSGRPADEVTHDLARDVQREFPHYRIWREAAGLGELRYVAQARNLAMVLHTVITADLAELRAELLTAPAPRAISSGAQSYRGGGVMTLHWVKEDTPRWDAEKQRLFGPDELAALGIQRSAPGAPVADEWWRVTDDDGAVVGYGRLDSEWGDAEITFLVDPARRGTGIGAFILDRLEEEAAARGLNYIYNVIPETHPDPGWVAHWLMLHSFAPGTGDLRRRVQAARP